MTETVSTSTKSSLNLKHALAFFMIGIAGSLAVGGLYVYAKQARVTQEATVAVTQQENLVEQSASEADDSSMLEPDGKYLAYTPGDLEQPTPARRVLFFYTEGSPTSMEAHQNLIENANEIPDDLRVIRVNYDDMETDQTERELATKYAVTAAHTFVQIDENGEVITRWNGGEIEKLLSSVKE